MTKKNFGILCAAVVAAGVIVGGYLALTAYSRTIIKDKLESEIAKMPVEMKGSEVEVTKGSPLTMSGYDIEIEMDDVLYEDETVLDSASMSFKDVGYDLKTNSARSRKPGEFNAEVSKEHMTKAAQELMPYTAELATLAKSGLSGTKLDLRNFDPRNISNEELKTILLTMGGAAIRDLVTGSPTFPADMLTGAARDALRAMKTDERKLPGSDKRFERKPGRYVNISDVIDTQGMLDTFLVISEDGKKINVMFEPAKDAPLKLPDTLAEEIEKKINPIFDKEKSVRYGDFTIDKLTYDGKTLKISGAVPPQSVSLDKKK